jgi:hypothetical protein
MGKYNVCLCGNVEILFKFDKVNIKEKPVRLFDDLLYEVKLCPICLKPFTKLRPPFRRKWEGQEVHCRCYCQKLWEYIKGNLK